MMGRIEVKQQDAEEFVMQTKAVDGGNHAESDDSFYQLVYRQLASMDRDNVLKLRRELGDLMQTLSRYQAQATPVS